MVFEVEIRVSVAWSVFRNGAAKRIARTTISRPSWGGEFPPENHFLGKTAGMARGDARLGAETGGD